MKVIILITVMSHSFSANYDDSDEGNNDNNNNYIVCNAGSTTKQ